MIRDTHSKEPFWIKRFMNQLRSSDLNQMIRDTHSKEPFWIKRFMNQLWSSDLNQMIRDTRSKSQSETNDSRYTLWRKNPKKRFEGPIWIKRLALALKFRSESMIHDTRSKADLKQTIRDPIGATHWFYSEFQKTQFNPSLHPL